MEEKLKKSQNYRESRNPGKDVIGQVPFASVNTISYMKRKAYNQTFNGDELFNFSNIPFRLHIDDIRTEFIHFCIV